MISSTQITAALGILARVVQGAMVAVAVLLLAVVGFGSVHVLGAMLLLLIILALLAFVVVLEIPVRAIQRSVGSGEGS